MRAYDGQPEMRSCRQRTSARALDRSTSRSRRAALPLTSMMALRKPRSSHRLQRKISLALQQCGLSEYKEDTVPPERHKTIRRLKTVQRVLSLRGSNAG